MDEDRFDDLALSLARPIPRRRALGLFGIGLAAAAVPSLTAPRARAAGQLTPCSHGGTFCGYPDGGGYNIGCCLGAGGDTRTVCCPGKSGVVGSLCCPTGYKCGNTRPDPPQGCICVSKVECGGTCCRTGEYCETRFLGEDTCDKLCPHTHEHKCIGVCCTDNETCGFFGCKCKSGLVSTGAGTCESPKKDPGDPQTSDNPIRNMLNMMGQSAAGHGAKRTRGSFIARPALSGSTAVDGALEALAAVNGQGAAALLAIRGGKRDPAYKKRVVVARAKPPLVVAGPGLDPASAAALNKLLRAEARANALTAAMAKALWRSRAARARHHRSAARRQMRAAASFAGQAATAYKRVRSLRAAAARTLIAGNVSEVLALDDAVDAFAKGVKRNGVPASLRISMTRLGVGRTDRERLRAGVIGRSVTAAAGPVLIAPLQSDARAGNLTALISQLSKFSKRARKHPTAR